jgi:hypothetical protein
MRFRNLEIQIDNSGAAFDDPALEVARILREQAQRIADGGVSNSYLFDFNGNRCGFIDYNFSDDET